MFFRPEFNLLSPGFQLMKSPRSESEIYSSSKLQHFADISTSQHSFKLPIPPIIPNTTTLPTLQASTDTPIFEPLPNFIMESLPIRDQIPGLGVKARLDFMLLAIEGPETKDFYSDFQYKGS